ncbi:hypothetical protein B0J14DRAFT_234173 [Halenospora varia]|nr:hypothetical protein B0J14DRAFT_234173 [Halenospora varia]
MAELPSSTVSTAALLEISPEIRAMIYEELIYDPTCDPDLLLQFLLLTCHEISNEAERLIRGQDTSKTHSLDDWRLYIIDEEADSMTPFERNMITKVYIDAMGWNMDLEDFDDPEEAKMEDGHKFWECNDYPIFWLLEIIERFPGAELLKLESDPHGYMWSTGLGAPLVDEVNDTELEKYGIGLGWKVESVDEEEDKMALHRTASRIADSNFDWRQRERHITLSLVSGY